TIATFGDMTRVPGSSSSLLAEQAAGRDIQIVYSPLDAVEFAQQNPDKQVVFLAVGFETTVPAACLAVKHAAKLGLANFSILGSNKTMPNAYKALEGSADAFLYPGHVNAITGTAVCEELAAHGVSGVVAGFTADEIVTALAVIVTLSQTGTPFFRNCYPRVVKPEGSPAALKLMETVMKPCDAEWRGLGVIPGSGLTLREEYAAFDARLKYHLPPIRGKSHPACRCGEVLQGKCKSTDCKLFGTACTPLHPVGACMVSNEGACSAYYQYGEHFNG
ncbi:MAG: hydrogenase formation protein HypD, partial [Clostridia bacterium]|nr:hydrogenase formation protein HypD [Clostridia bacterium]